MGDGWICAKVPLNINDKCLQDIGINCKILSAIH